MPISWGPKATPVLATMLVLATGFYLSTGVVREDGGFGYDLVIKPRLEFETSFGGSDRAWRRDHPTAPPPWWRAEPLRVIAHGDLEQSRLPWWEVPYGLGQPLGLVGWIVLLLRLVWVSVRWTWRAVRATPRHGR
jgi:hypothetical protein